MYRPAREGRSFERFNGYKTINQIPLLYFLSEITYLMEICLSVSDQCTLYNIDNFGGYLRDFLCVKC